MVENCADADAGRKHANATKKITKRFIIASLVHQYGLSGEHSTTLSMCQKRENEEGEKGEFPVGKPPFSPCY